MPGSGLWPERSTFQARITTFQVHFKLQWYIPIIHAIKIIHSLTAQIGSHRYEYSVKLDAGPL